MGARVCARSESGGGAASDIRTSAKMNCPKSPKLSISPRAGSNSMSSSPAKDGKTEVR